MKIVYLIAGMYRAAGMERVVAMKAGWLASHGHKVLIVTTEQKGRDSAFELAEGVRMVDIPIGYEDDNGAGLATKMLHFPFRKIKHRRLLKALLEREKADVVVSTFCNDASFLPSIKDGSRKILEVHFSRFKRLQYGRKGLWALADRILSRSDRRSAGHFDKFVVLTEEDRGYWGDMANICVIPNARTFEPFERSPRDGSAEKTVLAVGRYSRQKGFDRLLEAWKCVVADGAAEGWRLRVAGDGELRKELEDQAARLGIAGSVVFGKADGDIRALYDKADILALSSRYEGLPMVLLEAQAASLPVVAMTCKCGPRDVLTDGVDAFLTEEGDVPAFAEAMERMMADCQLRQRMGSAARRNSDNYRFDAIMARWMEVFSENG